MDSIKVYLTGKKRKFYTVDRHEPYIVACKDFPLGRWLYCWEFVKESWLTYRRFDVYEGYYYKTNNNLYRLFYNNEYGFWIGRFFLYNNGDAERGGWGTVEKELGAVYCETLKGRFYWK